MNIVFDKYFFRSNAASAQILRKKYQNGEFGHDVIIFSTTQTYKGSKDDNFNEDEVKRSIVESLPLMY